MFYAKTSSSINLYATIKKDGSLGWVSRNRAAQFSSEEDAASRIAAAAAKVPAKADMRPETRAMFDARVVDGKPQLSLSSARIAEAYVLERSISTMELADGFDLFYVKGPEGWLSTPRSKDHYAKYQWIDNFADAKPFASEAEARAGHAAMHGRGRDSISLFTARAVFTQVEPASGCQDPGILGLRAACEARDIRADLAKASQDRHEAFEASKTPKAQARRI